MLHIVQITTHCECHTSSYLTRTDSPQFHEVVNLELCKRFPALELQHICGRGNETEECDVTVSEIGNTNMIGA
jgi:hypothetical protein